MEWSISEDGFYSNAELETVSSKEKGSWKPCGPFVPKSRQCAR